MGVEDKDRASGDLPREQNGPVLPTVNPDVPATQSPQSAVHPAFYVILWISLSSSVILFNKWILSTLEFSYPVILTTFHMAFSTVITQLLARYTSVLDGRKTVKMTGRVYLRAIVPIGFFFSLSLIFGNLAYLYLSVAFIQMLKATTPVFVLISGWFLGLSSPDLRKFLNVSVIVIGVIIASIGEIKFVWIGFIYQICGVVFEALRLNLVQRILNGADYKMDPLVSLYYFAPVCAAMNFVVALFWEVPKCTMEEVYNVGLFTFLLNGFCAFFLNVAVVLLIGKTSGLVMTLCGVLKDVLLVVASMIIWGTQVSGLQFFGYSLALCGMIYYKLGYEAIKGHLGDAGRQWADFGNRQPVLRRLSIIAMVLFTIFFVLNGLAPAGIDPTDYINEAKTKIGMRL
ncbi:Triose-phosphate Transporter family domain containing protein [Naviculisporaceae sp. PSN 640]